MSPIDYPKIYNPANQTPEELIANFVVRLEIFRKIYRDIKSAPMTYPEQHYIIQGARGQGKTTLLLRLAYEIRKDETLSTRLIPIIFNEEQYNISRLYKLWETTAEYLAEAGYCIGLAAQMETLDTGADYEERCFKLLEDGVQKINKKLILFIDNIDQMLGKFSKKEHQRLREIFIESAALRLIGASAVCPEFHYNYGEPFYQFFKMPALRGLNLEETKTLLINLSEHYQTEQVRAIIRDQPGRVTALHRITGGVIRTIVILFEIFTDEQGSAYLDLEKILDSVTPLYKHRMDNLSAQQQEIVDFIALKWDAVTTREIAAKTNLPSKAVSAQLNQLQKYHIIDKELTSTKNHLYRLSERFFNIWYLMRLGRRWDKRRVQFLVEFLQIWCDPGELEQKARRHMSALREGHMYEKHALFMTEALARTSLDRNLQHNLITQTRACLEKQGSQLREYLSESDKELVEAAEKAYIKQDYNEALRCLEEVKNKNGVDYNNLGVICRNALNDFNKAEKYYLMAANQNPADSANSLAWLYFENKLNKPAALEYAAKAYTHTKDIYSAHTYSMILLWHNNIEKALEVSADFITDPESYKEFANDIALYLQLLIAKKQYHQTLKLFNENPCNLKDRFKPLYYALISFMRSEYPDEYLKMGPELKETVEEIVARINILTTDYR